MDAPAVTVTIPRKDGVSTAESDDAPVPVWPLIESAFGRIGVEDEAIWDAARTALTSSDGCVVLANYLNSEAKRVPKMDYAFKVPLIVLASQMALDDDGCDCIYDPDEGAVYFETDDAQYSFHVFKDWTVDWAAIADDVQAGYTWSGIENQTWALDQLLRYIDYGEGPAAST